MGGEILPALMGSPDHYGRQLDGMGSGISSTSKICILSPSLDKSVAGVEFTFVQVGVKDGSLDTAGNCGNMLSIVGPVAFDGGLSEHCRIETDPQTGERTAMVRIFNTNTRKVVH
jgi:2-methylaconitate cis-trans-isomerase PrpF